MKEAQLRFEPYGASGRLLKILPNGLPLFDTAAADKETDTSSSKGHLRKASQGESEDKSIADDDEEVTAESTHLEELRVRAEKLFLLVSEQFQEKIREKDEANRNEEVWSKVTDYQNEALNELRLLNELFHLMRTPPPGMPLNAPTGTGSAASKKRMNQMAVHNAVRDKTSLEVGDELSLSFMLKWRALHSLKLETEEFYSCIRPAVAQQLKFQDIVTWLRRCWLIRKVPYAPHVFSESDNEFPYRAQLAVELCNYVTGCWGRGVCSVGAPCSCWPPIPSASPFATPVTDLYIVSKVNTNGKKQLNGAGMKNIASGDATSQIESDSGSVLGMDGEFLQNVDSHQNLEGVTNSSQRATAAHTVSAFDTSSSDRTNNIAEESVTGGMLQAAHNILSNEIRTPDLVENDLSVFLGITGDIAHFVKHRFHLRVSIEVVRLEVGKTFDSRLSELNFNSKSVDVNAFYRRRDTGQSKFDGLVVEGTTLPLAPTVSMPSEVSRSIDLYLRIARWISVDRTINCILNGQALDMRREQESGRGRMLEVKQPVSCKCKRCVADKFATPNARTRGTAFELDVEVLSWATNETTFLVKNLPALDFGYPRAKPDAPHTGVDSKTKSGSCGSAATPGDSSPMVVAEMDVAVKVQYVKQDLSEQQRSQRAYDATRNACGEVEWTPEKLFELFLWCKFSEMSEVAVCRFREAFVVATVFWKQSVPFAGIDIAGDALAMKDNKVPTGSQLLADFFEWMCHEISSRVFLDFCLKCRRTGVVD